VSGSKKRDQIEKEKQAERNKAAEPTEESQKDD